MPGLEGPSDGRKPTNLTQFQSFVKEEWSKLPQEMCSKLCGYLYESNQEEQRTCYRLLAAYDGLGYE